MTEPTQYFKGRTVQEQMNEVIGYVDARSTEVASDVAAAKASEVLVPAEAAKVAAQAAQDAAEDAQSAAETAKAGAEAARDTTLAALPQVQSDIDALEGRMDTVELKVTTAEGNIVTIQGQIVALQTADGQNIKLTGENAIGNYAVLLTGNQGPILGTKIFSKPATLALHESGSNNQNGWRKIFVSPTFANSNEENGFTFELISNAGQYGLFSAFGRSGSLSNVVRRAGNFPVSNVKMSIDENNEVILWSYSYRTIGIVNIEAHAGNNVVTFADSGTITVFPEPTTESYRQVITATE